MERRLLAAPILGLSLVLERQRREYYDRLDAVRTTGDLEGWLRYFLEGIEAIAAESIPAGDRPSGRVPFWNYPPRSWYTLTPASPR